MRWRGGGAADPAVRTAAEKLLAPRILFKCAHHPAPAPDMQASRASPQQQAHSCRVRIVCPWLECLEEIKARDRDRDTLGLFVHESGTGRLSDGCQLAVQLAQMVCRCGSADHNARVRGKCRHRDVGRALTPDEHRAPAVRPPAPGRCASMQWVGVTARAGHSPCTPPSVFSQISAAADSHRSWATVERHMGRRQRPDKGSGALAGPQLPLHRFCYSRYAISE